jgi:phosphatidylserine/phosphatidylglycerophosphate/cardiolipin synthase-like enzyme
VPLRGGLLALLALAAPLRAEVGSVWAPVLPPVPVVGVPGRVPAPAAPAVPRVSYKGRSWPSVQFGRETRLSETIIAALDRTERTARLALYDLKHAELGAAILRAHARGVKVELVYDEGHAAAGPAPDAGPSREFQALLDAGVPVVLRRGRGSYGIMHHKFAVLDGELVITGSFNWTRAADDRHYENLILRGDAASVEGFDAVWAWMRDAAGAQGPPPADPERPVAFNGGRWPRWAFSPQGGLEAYLVEAIGRSRATFDACVFSLYSLPVAEALIAAKERGVAVRVLSDAGQSRRSPAMARLAAAGVEIRLSAGRADFGVMHHKYALADGAWLLTGSYNFSQNGEMNNHENALFSTRPGELGAYGREFAFLWDQGRVPGEGDLPAPNSL